MSMYGGSNYGDDARAQEMARQAAVDKGIATINKNFAQFNDPYYEAKKQDYINYAMPVFQDQYIDTRNSLTAAMAKRGLLNSSAAVKAATSLQKYAGQKTREIGDTAQGQANQLRQDVSNEQQALTNQVIASGDPSQASTSSLAAAGALQRPSAFGPLGNYFTDWTNVYMANQYNQQQNLNPYQQQPLFSFGGQGGQNPSQYIVQ